MSEGQLDPVEPERLAAAGTVLSGRVPVAALAGLHALLAATEGQAAGDAEYRLVFERDGHGRLLVSGEAVATVPMQCQRCLEPVMTPLSVAFSRVVVDSEPEARALPAELDPLLRAQRLMDPAALVEEELMVAMPQVARHETVEECGAVARNEALDVPVEDEAPPPDEGPTQRPFEVLAGLRGKEGK